MKNKHSLKKFQIMSQVESRMTVSKAIAIWKVNSEVQGIESQINSNYRDLCLQKLVLTIRKTIHNQKLVGLLAIQEHSESILKVKTVNRNKIINFYKEDNRQQKAKLQELEHVDEGIAFPDQLISSRKPAILKKQSDMVFKLKLLTKMLSQFEDRFNTRSTN